MQPPAAIAAAHQKVLADIEGLAAATDTLMTAIGNKDQAAFDAALKEGGTISKTFQTDMGSLGALVGGTTASS